VEPDSLIEGPAGVAYVSLVNHINRNDGIAGLHRSSTGFAFSAFLVRLGCMVTNAAANLAGTAAVAAAAYA